MPYAVPGGDYGLRPMPDGYVPVGQLATVKQPTNLRAEPNTTSQIYTELPTGSRVDVLCWTAGEPTYGTDKYGSMWLSVAIGGWVHSFLVTAVDVGPC